MTRCELSFRKTKPTGKVTTCGPVRQRMVCACVCRICAKSISFRNITAAMASRSTVVNNFTGRERHAKYSMRMKSFEAMLDGVSHYLRIAFSAPTNLDQAPQGTIIHPSVYHCLDEFVVQASTLNNMSDRGRIENWRAKMLGTEHHFLNQGFWSDGDPQGNDELKTIRILVCGNTGVGKSTLINQVFGVNTDHQVVSSL